MKRTALSGAVLAGLLLLVYLGVCAYMFFNQASLIYFPERGYGATPASVGLPFEDVRLKTGDGVAIAAWWVPAEKPRGAVVLAHGNGGNMSHRLDKMRLFHDLGYRVMAFDYRGYGASEGKPSEEGTCADMAAAVDHVGTVRGIEQRPPRPLRRVPRRSGGHRGGRPAPTGGRRCGFLLHERPGHGEPLLPVAPGPPSAALPLRFPFSHRGAEVPGAGSPQPRGRCGPFLHGAPALRRGAVAQGFRGTRGRPQHRGSHGRTRRPERMAAFLAMSLPASN